MKKNWKTLSVVALAGLMILGSCKKNEENNTTNGGFTINAGIEQPNDNAKTSLNPSNGAISWSAGDQIVVNGTTLSLLGNGGSSRGSFYTPESFAEATQFVAAYPAGATMSGKEVTFTLPSTQTLDAAGTFGNGANPMVAYTEDIEAGLTFQSVCGAMRVKLAGEGIVTKLVLTSKNTSESLWGTLTVNAENPVATGCTGGSNVITLEIPGGIAANSANMPEVFITLPDGVLADGFKLEAFNGSELLNYKETTPETGTVAIVMNGISSPVQYPVELPHGTVATQEALEELLEEVAAGDYTGPITLMGDEITLDFNMAETDAPITQQIVVAQGANVEIQHLNAKTTTAEKPAIVINDAAEVQLDYVKATSSKGTTPAISVNNAELVIENSNISTTSTASDARPINVEDYANVTIRNTNIEAANGSYSRGLNIYGNHANVEVEGGSITNARYAVNFPSSANTVNVTLDGVTIEGWAAVNIWGGPDHHVVLKNCTLTGTNNFSGSSDNFATIVFNVDVRTSTIELDNCRVNAVSNAGCRQWAVDMRDPTCSCKLIMKNNTKVYKSGTNNPTAYSLRYAYTDGYYHQNSGYDNDPEDPLPASMFEIDGTYYEEW